MFDYEKMSQKDQDRFNDEMTAELDRLDQEEKQADVDFPPNSGAPLDPEAGTEDRTWCSVQRKFVTHQSLGATVTKLQKGWRRLVGLHKRYYFKPGLKVVSIVYWPEGLDKKGVN